MMFKFPTGRPDSETMRQAAQTVGVGWDETPIVFDGGQLGYAEAPDDADPTPIQDELERLVGIRPTVQS